jgi:serine/threonine-protein kinase
VRRLVIGAAAVAMLALEPQARAQQASTTGTASALFDEGVALMEQGRYAEACPKLARSNELSPNGGTLFALAECYELNGQVASAWVTYREAAIRAKAAGKEEAVNRANAAASKLEAQLARLAIVVPKPVEGISVTLDERPVTREEWGVATPIDPGTHVVRASAPGHKPFSQSVRVDTRPVIRTLKVPLLEPLPTRGGGQRVLGIIVAGLGVGGLGAGTWFGLQAADKNEEAGTHCRNGTECDAEGIVLDKEGRQAATISTISFIAGGALVAGGVLLFLTAPSGREQPVALGARPIYGGGAFTFGGRF